jgi:hypothetical protein
MVSYPLRAAEFLSPSVSLAHPVHPDHSFSAPGATWRPTAWFVKSLGTGTVSKRLAAPEGLAVVTATRSLAAIFVDRACTEHWIVRDPEGHYWIVPPVANAWECRQPFWPTEETALEPVPGHYRFMLGLPF